MTTPIEAFATGYASIDSPDIWPLTPGARLRARAASMAYEVAPDLLAVAEAGAKAAATTALHRKRIALYEHQAEAVMIAAAPFLSKVDPDKLTYLLALLAGNPRADRQAQAITSITGYVHDYLIGPPADWDDANSAAFAAAVRRGWAEAQISPDHGPADPAKLAKAEQDAAAMVLGIAGGGMDWTRRQISRLAWDLSPEAVLKTDDPQATVDGILKDHAGVGASAADLMHNTWGAAFLGGIAARVSQGYQQPLIDWVTQEDDLVCPVPCDDNEANGPYGVNDIPDFPAHPNCRCSLEPH